MNKPCARITLDLQQASTPTFVAVKKSDIGREIRITLSDGGFSYEISADCYAVLTGTKPDGNILYNHCDIEGNTIVYTVTEQTTAAAGRMKAEVKLYGADDQLVTSATFRIIIDGTVYDEGKVESKDEVSALTHLVSEAASVINNGNQMIDQGQQTIQSAETATQQATNAAEQAENSAADADAAAGAATQASNAADAATDKANTAAQNADSAMKLANDAAEKAYNAATAATQAAGEASAAAGNANTADKNARTATENANTAAEQANQAAETARDAVKSTNQAAQNASTEAENAANAAAAANEAAGKANDAANSANDACDRAADALAEAEQAAGAGAEAVREAELALEDAAAAIAGANAAAGNANEAADRANDASVLAEQADAKVEKLREVVSKFHSNIVEEAKGDSITLDDASDLELAGLKIFGKTEQFTTTGKNLLNLVDKNHIAVGCTGVVKNGVVTVTGTVTGSAYTFWLLGNYESTEVLFTLPVGTYTVKDCFLYSFDGATRVNKTGTFTVTEPFAVTGVLYKQLAVGTVVNETSYPQVEIGSVATAYEPYTGGIPSPNPDYPQPLVSVGDGGSVGVTVCGKNLLRGFTGTEENPYFITAKRDDYSVVIDGTTAFMEVGKPYTVSIYTDGVWGNVVGSDTVEWFLVKDGKYYNSIGATNNGKRLSKTFFIGVTGDYNLRLDVNKNGVTHSFWNAQVEEGTQATEYEPYKEQTITISTPNNLPGLPVSSGGNYTDSTGQQWVCDEVDFARGVYVQRIYSAGISDISRVSLPSWGGGRLFECFLNTNVCAPKEYTPILCSHLKGVTAFPASGQIAVGDAGRSLYVQMPEGTDILTTEQFSAWFVENQVSVIYALATPIETALTAEQLAAYAELHTNYPSTTLYNDAGAGMAVKYVADTKSYIDKKFAELAEAIVNS